MNLFEYNTEKYHVFIIRLITFLTIFVGFLSRLIVADDQVDWDEELYFLIARGWQHMVLPYSGIFDHKPPALYLIYLLLSGWGKHFYLVRIFTAFFLLGSSYFLINTLSSIYSSVKKDKLLLLSVLFIYFGCSLGTNTEIIYIPMLLLTLAFLLNEKPLMAAIFAAVTLSIKYTTFLDLAGIGLFYISTHWTSRFWIKNLTIWALSAFFISIFSYLAFYIYFKNYDIDLIQAILLANLQHASTERVDLFANNGLSRILIITMPMLGIGLWLNWKEKTKPITICLLLWFLLSLSQGLLTGKYYFHYFIPSAIPLILLISISISKINKFFIYIANALLLIISLIFFFHAISVHYKHLDLKNNFTPYCQNIKDGAYVMDVFIAAYRICNSNYVDKFVFPPFYIDRHFATVSNSGGLEGLKDKIKSGTVKGIIAVENSDKYKILVSKKFNDFTTIIRQDDLGKDKIVDRKITTKLLIKSLVNYLTISDYRIPQELLGSYRQAQKIIDTAVIMIFLFCFLSLIAFVFYALYRKKLDTPFFVKYLFLTFSIFSILVTVFFVNVVAIFKLEINSERYKALNSMNDRPFDPWPQNLGHIPFGRIGAKEVDKGYLEGAGTYSPWVSSFGVSIWLVDNNGKLIKTSDSIDTKEIKYKYFNENNDLNAPNINITTPYYDLTWQANSDNQRQLTAKAKETNGKHIEICFRSIGPSGSPLHSIKIVDDYSIELNNRWLLKSNKPIRSYYIGDEKYDNWTQLPPNKSVSSFKSDSGWAYVRFPIPGDVFNLSITDTQRNSITSTRLQKTPLVLNGLNAQFVDSLISQIEILKQGIVDNEMRPGDPLNYPLPWLRDNAYHLVSLAKSGETLMAKKLAYDFAKNDFFGGFGIEGDNPGLSLWALNVVSILSQDAEFDNWLWPHILRKVKLIEKMIDTKSEIRIPYSGIVVPSHKNRRDIDLLAGPNLNGLVNGRMDLELRPYYSSAVSYLGLTSATEFALRCGHPTESRAYKMRALNLKSAWQKAFEANSPDADGDQRTFIVSLWPAEIAPEKAYQVLLENKWRYEHFENNGAYKKRPLWTYFSIAEAHQWLRLGQPLKVWQVLDWFWAHQPMPGLFTLWEGDGEENEFYQWRNVRGWVNPPYVTPHYWSASELLLLQLGMLAEVSGSESNRKLIIGGGVPKSWLSKSIDVRGIGTDIGFVNWKWDNNTISVNLPKQFTQLPVKAGNAFPQDVIINVNYIDSH